MVDLQDAPPLIPIVRTGVGLFGLFMILIVAQSYFLNRREGQKDLQRHRKVVLISYAIFMAALVVGVLIVALHGPLWFAFGLGVVGAGAALVGTVGLGWLIIREHWD